MRSDEVAGAVVELLHESGEFSSAEGEARFLVPDFEAVFSRGDRIFRIHGLREEFIRLREFLHRDVEFAFEGLPGGRGRNDLVVRGEDRSFVEGILKTEKVSGRIAEAGVGLIHFPPGRLLIFILLYRFLHAFQRNLLDFDETLYQLIGIVLAFYSGDRNIGHERPFPPGIS